MARFVLVALAALAGAPLLAQPPKDHFGDPLPEGAKARVGTTRLSRPGGGSEWEGAVLTPDGKFLLSPVTAGAIERIDVSTGIVVGTVGEKVADRTGREHLFLSADGTRGLSLSDTTVTAWEVQTGRVLTRAVTRVDWTQPGALASGTLSADGSTLAFGINDRPRAGRPLTVVVWTAGDGKRRLDVEVEQDRYVSVALSPNGKLLATWGSTFAKGSPMVVPDAPVQFWDATTGAKLGRVVVKEIGHVAITFTPDGQSAVLADRAGKVLFIDPKTGRETRRLSVRADLGGRLTFSPDGKTLAVCGYDGTVRLWDVPGDKEISVTKCPGRIGAKHIAFTGNNTAVAWAIEGAKAVVYSVPSGKILSPAGGHTQAPHTFAFTPDGKELLSNGEAWTEWTVQRWDAATGRALGERKFDAPAGINLAGYRGLNVLPGGTKVLATAGVVQYVYDIGTGKRLHDLSNGGRDYSTRLCADGALAFTPLGIEPGQVAPPGRPRKFAVKELATDKAFAELELPAPGLQHAIRTPNGKRLITCVYLPVAGAGSFVVLSLWDLATGQKLGEVKHPGQSAYLTPGVDNTSVLATTAGGLQELDLTTGKVVRTLDTGGLAAGLHPVLSPDGKLFAVGLRDPADYSRRDGQQVRLYDTATGQLLKTFRGHAGLVCSLAFSPDSRTLASGSHDTTILLWDLTALDKK